MTEPRPIPCVDLKAQYASIKAEIDEAILSTVADAAFIGGERVRRFERDFAELCGVDHAVGCSSGTAALHLALIVAGVGPGDEVIVPSFTFIATAEAVVHTGATPVFVDSEPDTMCIDVGSVERAMTARTRAIVPVHLFGQCADMDALSALARAHHVEIIEDAAQAFLATCGTRRAGSHGRFGCFSLYPGKNLGAYGDGGMIVTNDDAAAERLRMLADHGRASKYQHEMVGYNYRLDALQAAICSVKLQHIERWTRARQDLARRYDELLVGLPLEPIAARRGHVYHLYVIRCDRRDELASHLRARQIGSGIHYPVPLHQQPAFRSLRRQERLPVAEAAAKRVISLPMYAELSHGDQDRVVTEIRRYYQEPSAEP